MLNPTTSLVDHPQSSSSRPARPPQSQSTVLLGPCVKPSYGIHPPRTPPTTPFGTKYALLERDEIETGGDFFTGDRVSASPTVVSHQLGEPNPRPASRRRLPPFIASLQPRLTLVNSGSVARDHLASERTFLAYVRTSLAIAATGVALVQLFTVPTSTKPEFNTSSTSRSIETYARPLGVAMVSMGMMVLATGFTRYFTIQTALVQGKFPVATVVIFGITIGLCVLVILTFAALLVFKMSL